jgi:hypothetical protein
MFIGRSARDNVGVREGEGVEVTVCVAGVVGNGGVGEFPNPQADSVSERKMVTVIMRLCRFIG